MRQGPWWRNGDCAVVVCRKGVCVSVFGGEWWCDGGCVVVMVVVYEGSVYVFWGSMYQD